MSNPDVIGIVAAGFMVAMVLIALLANWCERTRKERRTHRRKWAVAVALLCLFLIAWILPKSRAAEVLGLSALPAYVGMLMLIAWGLWKTWVDNVT